jgi:AhpD family alkylhydroperoxidase
MRLQPIDRPPTIMARLATFLMRRRLGKVMMPARIVYNRVPAMYPLMYQVSRLLEKGLELDTATRLLVQSWVAMANGCGFCVDIGRALAIEQGLGLDKFNALPNWRTSPLFDARERAALAYAEEVNRERRASDETFRDAERHFGERGVVELTILCAIENLFNYTNIPFGIEDDGLCALAERRAA